MISLYQISKSIPLSSRFSIDDTITRNADRLELQVSFHYNTASGGVSGSKFTMLPLESSEEEAEAAFIELKEQVIDYFITTQKIEIKE